MEIKDKLRRCRKIDEEISTLDRSRKTIYDTLLAATDYSSERVQASHRNHVDEKYTRLASLQEEIDQKIDELVDLKIDLFQLINTLDDSRYRNVLIDYYLNRKTWEEVAVNNHWTYRHTLRLHGQALQQLRAKEVTKCH
ncbi:DUF1492 domain-containing protein [Aerococcus sp. UMB8608]|uniref:DUF1492 domain-containing protein n=1 Tax=Aerococcus sanguinicola TaxID=119206 RepID=A0A109RDX5_9LACT|nr:MULTISPECIES: DUF1492 domain-containing protein [Aerococcus]AMB94911.1 hypothetical protein AWM72_00005 [Aerococcus sanguinicola]MDK6679360.1 DUF1492 domain-containing protein [Aerococcus sp. UMB8608]MDK6685798.1 DUF1492 domain-containing protein [Aerococcus sp. UMB8623]OFT95896.1 hypothetical protein HMPREF3090_03490 [Aerococcus sp. HMSC23C02]